MRVFLVTSHDMTIIGIWLRYTSIPEEIRSDTDAFRILEFDPLESPTDYIRLT